MSRPSRGPCAGGRDPRSVDPPSRLPALGRLATGEAVTVPDVRTLRLLPPAGTPPTTALLRGIGVAAMAAAGGVVLLALGYEDLYQRPLRIVLVLWCTLPFVTAGAIAWRRRPDSRFGPLLVAAGFATPASTLQWAAQPLPHTVGQLFDLLLPALWLHVFLAYPGGRLTRWPERLLVVATYGTALGLQFVVLMLGGFDEENLLAVTHRPTVSEAVQNGQLLILAGLCAAGAVLLWIRLHAHRPRPRRTAALLAFAFGVALVMVGALLVAGTFALPGFEILRLVTFGLVGLAPFAFLAGLLDARLARSGVADLVVRLGNGPPENLQELIARALRDPSLVVAYWLPTRGSWVDGNGTPVELPGVGAPLVTTLIERAGEPVAALLHDPALRDEPELLDSVSAAAGIALENGRLQAELQARLQELHGSRARVIEAAQTERRRLERNLHDGAQQRLVALALELRLLERELPADQGVREQLARLRGEVTASLDELRDVAHGIHPAVVTGHGLAVALESIAERTPLPLELAVDDLPRLPEPVEVTAYYVVCEGLANVGKHAGASRCIVDVRLVGETLVVAVTDDGAGGADPTRGSGLRGLADRVEALDGRLEVAPAPAGGTRLQAEIPVRDHLKTGTPGGRAHP
jgi:signal transduction histidine kinase